MGKKILVVDDDISLREMLNLTLKTLGYDVSLAENWKKALNLLKSENFDILMTDFQMPPMEGITNGIELIRFVKLNEINSEMKIILMSAEMNESIELVALAAGTDAAVNKFEICRIEAIKKLLELDIS
ncbi:MAG: response regulator [Patescibacteria group bacterium]